MEIPTKYLVAIILGVIVLTAIIILLIETISPVPGEIELEKSFQRGCAILAKNNCDFNIVVDGKNFRDIIKELGYSEESVRKRCCITYE